MRCSKNGFKAYPDIFREDVDLQELARYIHLNPVRAKVVSDLKALRILFSNIGGTHELKLPVK